MTSEDEISEMVIVAREMAKNLAAVIQDVNHRMDLMAHNDYTGVSKIPEKYMGEFAAMNDAIHVMNTDMNETMHRIEEAASQVSAGSTNLAEDHRHWQRDLQIRQVQWKNFWHPLPISQKGLSTHMRVHRLLTNYL